MSNSANEKVRRHSIHPVLTVLLAVSLFLLGDNLIFRSAFYVRFVPRVTTGGRLAHFVQEEKSRPPSGKKDVLFTGASRMQFALWDKVAEAAAAGGRIKMIQGAVHGSTEKWTYYLLKYLDPNHNRYSAIVISDSEYKVLPAVDDSENDFACAQALTPFLSLEDWPQFVSTFTDPAVREEVEYQGVFASHGVGMDLLLNVGRIGERILQGGATRLLTDEGPEGTVNAFATTGGPRDIRIVSYPPQFDSFERRGDSKYFRYFTPQERAFYTVRNARFHKTWLTRIIELYKGSLTRLIFVRMPLKPFPMPVFTPISSAPDVRSLIPAEPNVMFVDEDEFAFLERPEYFWDLLHLNRDGRRLFSERIGALLGQILDHGDSAATIFSRPAARY